MEPTVAALLFWSVCLGVRAGLAALLRNERVRRLVGAVYLATGVRMLWLYASGSRLRAPEAANDRTWWNWARPLFAVNYLAIAVAVAVDWHGAPLLGAADVALGAAVWLHAAATGLRR